MAKKKVNKNEKKSFYRGVLTTISILCFMLAIGFGVYTGLEFYDQVKNNGSSQQVLLQMAIKQVFEEKYGKKVTDKEVEEAFEKMKSVSSIQNIFYTAFFCRQSG